MCIVTDSFNLSEYKRRGVLQLGAEILSEGVGPDYRAKQMQSRCCIYGQPSGPKYARCYLCSRQQDSTLLLTPFGCGYSFIIELLLNYRIPETGRQQTPSVVPGIQPGCLVLSLLLDALIGNLAHFVIFSPALGLDLKPWHGHQHYKFWALWLLAASASDTTQKPNSKLTYPA